MNRWIISTLAGLLCGAAFSFAAAADDLAAGKLLFETNCASCHGLTGKGDGPVGAVLTPRPRDFAKAEFKFDTDADGEAGTDADLQNLVKNGAMAYGGSPLMAPLPHLSGDDVTKIIVYIRSLKE